MTVLTQIEACLNSHPLTPLNLHDDDGIFKIVLLRKHTPTYFAFTTTTCGPTWMRCPPHLVSSVCIVCQANT